MASAVINKAALFERVGHKPHAGQRRIYRSRARNRVCSCGRRFGKSVVGGMEIVCECYMTYPMLRRLEDRGERREFWIVGPEYTDSEKEFRVVWNTLKARGVPFDKPGSYYSAHDSDMQLSCFNGKFLVIGKSAKHPERLVGEGLNGVVMSEAAKQRESTWTKYIRPMLADYKGWSLFTSTPEGKNWFYNLWMRGQSEVDEEWESWRMPSWRNPYVYPLGASINGIKAIRAQLLLGALSEEMRTATQVDPEVISLIRDLTEETFNQEIAALFTEFVGRVFKDWDDEVHVRDLTFNSSWETYAAVDYGFTNPFVWLLIQVDPFGNVYVMDEFYQAGLTIEEAAAEVKTRGLAPGSLIRFYPDPASPGDTRALEHHLRVRSARGTGGELNTRLRYIRAALRRRANYVGTETGATEPLPRLIANRSRCPNFIREMNDYRYPKTAQEAAERGKSAPELPMKKDDHCPEALGRFYVGHFGRPRDEGGSRTSDADLAA
jgi:hypothetical protein